MPHRYHQKVAQSSNDLVVRGNYFEISVVEIVLDATVKPSRYDDELQRLTLFETIYTNLWDYRLSTQFPEPLLIDSKGFQYSAYSLCSDAAICKSKKIQNGMNVSPVANEIEGHAKTKGWIAFPFLKKSIVPYKLVFRIQVFEPGYTCGSVQDSETLELIFDLSLFGRLLNENTER